MKPYAAWRRSARRAQRGVTMLVVLILLTVMLMGGLALSRLTEISTMATGNSTFRDIAMQASEVGLNTGHVNLRALVDLDNDQGGWYFATMRVADANGLPTVEWDSAPETPVGAYSVRMVAERMCSTNTVVNRLEECMVRQMPQIGSRDPSQPRVEPPNVVQYRVTVRVRGPRGTELMVQSLMTRG